MHGTEPGFNEILVITITIQNTKCILYHGITEKCEHVTKNPAVLSREIFFFDSRREISSLRAAIDILHLLYDRTARPIYFFVLYLIARTVNR